MKLFRGTIILLAVAFLASAAHQAKAVTYGDASNDVFTAAGGGILDIQSVEVNNTATDLILKINVAGDPVATDWGKYMVAIDSVPIAGDTTGNGWGRPISMSAGMDYWVGSWVDGGNGIELRRWDNPGWPNTNASYAYPQTLAVSKDTTSITLTVPLASMGLGLGSVILFDVYTSGGGATDGAVDSLANPSQSIGDWGNPYNSTLVDSYTVVPEPSTLLLVGFGGLMLMGRIFRRRA